MFPKQNLYNAKHTYKISTIEANKNLLHGSVLIFLKPNEPKINEPNFEESSFRVCYAFWENLGENLFLATSTVSECAITHWLTGYSMSTA